MSATPITYEIVRVGLHNYVTTLFRGVDTLEDIFKRIPLDYKRKFVIYEIQDSKRVTAYGVNVLNSNIIGIVSHGNATFDSGRTECNKENYISMLVERITKSDQVTLSSRYGVSLLRVAKQAI